MQSYQNENSRDPLTAAAVLYFALYIFAVDPSTDESNNCDFLINTDLNVFAMLKWMSCIYFLFYSLDISL